MFRRISLCLHPDPPSCGCFLTPQAHAHLSRRCATVDALGVNSGISLALKGRIRATLKKLCEGFPEVRAPRVLVVPAAEAPPGATDKSYIAWCYPDHPAQPTIYLSQEWWADGSKFDARMKTLSSDWFVDASVEGVITHEFGHLLFDALAARIGYAQCYEYCVRQYHVARDISSPVDATLAPSRYGRVNCFEATAEDFVAWYEIRMPSGQDAARIANVLWPTLQRWSDGMPPRDLAPRRPGASPPE